MIVEEMRYNIPRFARTELYFNKFVIMLSPTSVLKNSCSIKRYIRCKSLDVCISIKVQYIIMIRSYPHTCN